MAGIDHADDIEMLELGELWEEFHRAVNMTSDELGAWLRTQSAGEVSEDLPEDAGTEQGRHVLSILRKRQTDLTDADIRTMREVVRIVAEEHPEGPASGSVDNADEAWRHRLMRIGHDPLKPW